MRYSKYFISCFQFQFQLLELELTLMDLHEVGNWDKENSWVNRDKQGRFSKNKDSASPDFLDEIKKFFHESVAAIEPKINELKTSIKIVLNSPKIKGLIKKIGDVFAPIETEPVYRKIVDSLYQIDPEGFKKAFSNIEDYLKMHPNTKKTAIIAAAVAGLTIGTMAINFAGVLAASSFAGVLAASSGVSLLDFLGIGSNVFILRSIKLSTRLLFGVKIVLPFIQDISDSIKSILDKTYDFGEIQKILFYIRDQLLQREDLDEEIAEMEGFDVKTINQEKALIRNLNSKTISSLGERISILTKKAKEEPGIGNKIYYLNSAQRIKQRIEELKKISEEESSDIRYSLNKEHRLQEKWRKNCLMAEIEYGDKIDSFLNDFEELSSKKRSLSDIRENKQIILNNFISSLGYKNTEKTKNVNIEIVSQKTENKRTDITREDKLLIEALDPNEWKERVSKGAEECRKLLSIAGIHDINLSLVIDNRRGDYDNKSKLNMGVMSEPAFVAYHETGHVIDKIKDTIEESAAFVRAKATSKEPVQIYQNSPNEIALPDHFFDIYVGKVYKDGEKDYASEVVSMGLQNLASPDALAKFAKEDREHLMYTLSVLKREY